MRPTDKIAVKIEMEDYDVIKGLLSTILSAETRLDLMKDRTTFPTMAEAVGLLTWAWKTSTHAERTGAVESYVKQREKN